MDSRPFRPRPSENTVAPLHQRHKSTGNLAAMAATAATIGFQRPAKRAAFGDVTNMSRTTALGRDESKGVKPQQSSNVLPARANKENGVAGKDSSIRLLRRPASSAVLKTKSANEPRPINPSIRLVQQDQHHRHSDSVALPPLPPIPDTRISLNQPRSDSLPIQPRHHKSQPQLRQQQPTLRKTQSKQFEKLSAEPIQLSATVPEEPEHCLAPLQAAIAEDVAAPDSGDTIYLDSMQYPPSESQPEVNHAVNYNKLSADLNFDEPPTSATEASVKEGTYPALSEPTEYWDEEEDEDYDEQDPAYTTAHSFRSRDMTSGNVTTVLAPRQTAKTQRELDEAKALVTQTMTEEEIEEEVWDVSMVAEYGDEIFDYLRELEIKMLPNPHYMEMQNEIQWSMRAVLMDWLVQVHNRFGLLPETLYLTVNYIDRFLSYKVVSIGKLQLVGATAILLASKYEEINCPSLEEIVYMVDNGYPTEEIIKAERFMLSMLNFELGWPGPMSFLRRVSKADDYDLDTRTLAKYFLELTIMDERFVASPPSFLAAGAHCLSRYILHKGDWTKHHVHYSGYTWTQLRPLVSMMLECCEHPRLHHASVYEKYSDKKFKEVALIVQDALDAGFTLPSLPSNVRPSQSTGHSTPSLEQVQYIHSVLASH